MKTIILNLTVLLFCSLAIFSQTVDEIESLINKSEFDTASTKIESVLKKQPNNQAILTQKVRILVIKKQYLETETLTNKLLTSNPKNKVALNARGIVKRDSKKDYVAALADFDKALAIDAEYPQAASNRAITLIGGKIGKKSEALDALSFAIELNPENTIIRGLRGQLLNQFSRYKFALYDLNKALQINKNLPLYSERAFAEMFLGMNNNALEDAETAIRINSNDSLAYSIRAYCRYLSTQEANIKESAILDAKKALEIDSQNFIAHMVIGFDKKLAKKDNVGAFSDFEAAYKIYPTNKWVYESFYNHLNSSPELVKNNPQAEKLLLETSKIVETEWREQIEIKKLAVNEEPWDFQLYEKLQNTWKNFRSFLSRDVRSNVGIPAWKAEQKAENDYWIAELGKNPKNHCVGYFRATNIDLGADGLYNPDNKKSDRYKLDYLKKQLDNYDGINGAECAARTALWIAEIYQTPYSTEKNFDLAKQYAEKSKQIKSDLKDDPNTISGIASTADESLANTEYWKAQDDAWMKELEEMKKRGAEAALRNSRRGRGDNPNLDPVKVQAAISEFERIHPRIERLAASIFSSAAKVQSAGQFSFFYRGTRQGISNNQQIMLDIYDKFMAQHGEYLPNSLLNHLKSDIRKSSNIRNDWVTGEAYSTYRSGGCSDGWSGYGC